MHNIGVRPSVLATAAARRRKGKRVRKALALSVALVTLVGCSSSGGGSTNPLSDALSSVTSLFELEPVPGWEPPAWGEEQGAGLGITISTNSSATADAAEPSDAADAATSLGNGDALGFTGGRIRNDAVGFAARYVQLPMRHRFNERMEELLWEAIGQTSGTFTPEVFPESALLNDRGCVPGSLTWPAERVLTDPATGPVGATATAFICEVLEAYGNILGVGVRIVSGSVAETDTGAATIDADRMINLYANVSDGSVHESIPRWSADAPVELWQGVVALLRREAGGLSTVEIAAPTEDQVALAKEALDRASGTGAGHLTLTIAPGITSPELEGLGVQPTHEPIAVQVDAELSARWVSDELEAIHTDRLVPFVGVPAWNASLPVNCMLLACIAVTYDDGPSPLTPGLLDTLFAQRAPVTFFMLGKAAAAAPDTVLRAAREGHEIGSHSVNHPDLTKLPTEEANDQVRKAADTIAGITGVPVTSFRPPYGAVNAEIIKTVGLPAILWSIDTNDWQEPGKAVLLERSVGEARPGDIVLFHDTHADSVEVAHDVVVGLRNRGFAMVTVTELFDGALPSGRVGRR